MLFNPNWNRSNVTKSKFMTMPHLIEWLKTKPAGETYNYSSISTCLLAQYLKAHGRWMVAVGGSYYRCCRWSPLGWMIVRKLPEGFADIALYFSHKGNTFGAALKRAEAWIGSHS